MDCCCKQDQSIITEYSVNNGNNGNTNINTQNTPKLKYSFRTQQATSKINNTINTTNYSNTMNNSNYNNNTQTINYNNNNNTLRTSSLVHNYSPQQQKMYSTVASNNQLLQLQRQRQQLIIQDRQLDVFYQTRIVPLEKEVQFFEHQVQVRNIEIMELQDLLSHRVKDKHSVQINPNQQHNLNLNINQQHNHIQSNVVNHSMVRGQGNHLPMKQNVNNVNQNVPMRQIVPAVHQQIVPAVHQQQQLIIPVDQQQIIPVHQQIHNVPVQGPFITNQQVPQNIKVIRQSIVLPQQNILHQINKPTVVNSQVVIRPQQPIHH